ncbi:hypothetical protein LINPERHAP2_LOCUS29740, partial [Linum perenne]
MDHTIYLLIRLQQNTKTRSKNEQTSTMSESSSKMRNLVQSTRDPFPRPPPKAWARTTRWRRRLRRVSQRWRRWWRLIILLLLLRLSRRCCCCRHHSRQLFFCRAVFHGLTDLEACISIGQ